MCRRAFSLSLMVCMGLSLPGCSRLGLCQVESLASVDSPDGRYSAEILSKDCIGASAVKKVELRKNRSLFGGKTAVAVFDDSKPDKPARVTVRWKDERNVVISAQGARVWLFQPNWHDVRVQEQ